MKRSEIGEHMKRLGHPLNNQINCWGGQNDERRSVVLLVIAGCGDEYRNHTECRKVADLIETQLKNEVYEDERGESTLSDDADGYYAARLAGIE